MFVRCSWITLAVALGLVGCEGTTGPVTEGPQPSLQVSRTVATGTRTLQQSPDAPQLEAYRVSFWAFASKASSVQVNYQPAAGHSVGDPFLRFEIPKQGLRTGPDGTRLKRGDSLYITLTIDRVSLEVQFEPSGVTFSLTRPATLTLWYGNADPDLNDDGAVDETDQTLERDVALWSQSEKTQRWHKLPSKNNAREKVVAARLYHFSEYAVCW